MNRLVVESRDITYEAAGPRTPPPPGTPTLVLLHGFPLDCRVWANVATQMAEKYRVVRPNLRGFGPFTDEETFSIDDLAGDVRVLAHSLRDVPVVMAGLSMGGYVALSFAKQWIKELAGLALVNSRGKADAPEARPAREAMAQLARDRGTAAVVAQMLPNMLDRDSYTEHPAMVESLERIMLDTPVPTIANACLAMRDRDDYRGLLRETGDLPVTVISGDGDQIVPEAESQELGMLSDSIDHVRLPGCGHMSPVEAPELVAEALDRLMQRATRYAASKN
jgi:pimeloyl-ACP methyl ester carboxylesterase